jgi:uncharacterized phage protein gp47/JayE
VPDLPTFDELYDVGKTEVMSRDPSLSDWREGSNLDAVTGGGAMLADEVIRVIIAAFGEQFVDVATGSALDALALDRFGLTRLPATAAVGVLRFTRGSGVGAIAIPAGTQVSGTVNGVTVTVETDADAVIDALDAYVDVQATCTETGTGGNVDEDVLDTILDSIVDDPTATVTNPDRFAGGDVEENDTEFRDRIRRYFTTLRKGTVAALEAGARTVAGVQFATVDESFIAPEDGGYVAIYIGDPDGTGNSTLADAVAVEIENWRAAGIEVQVLPAAREEIDLEIAVVHAADVDAEDLTNAIRAAVFAYTDALAPNETLRISAVIAAVHAVSTDVISVTVSEPTSDMTPTAPQNAIRVIEAGLTVTLTPEA